jgi:hypothetical protein
MFYEFVVLPLLSYASFFYFTSVHTLFVVWNSLKGRVVVPKPNEDDLNQLLLISACQAAEMIRTREIRSQQLVEVYIRRLEHIDNLLNAGNSFVHILNFNKCLNLVVQENFDEAVETAKNVDDYLESLDPDSDEFKQVCFLILYFFTIRVNNFILVGVSKAVAWSSIQLQGLSACERFAYSLWNSCFRKQSAKRRGCRCDSTIA